LIERLIDVAAGKLGIAPFELRRRNLIPAEAMPFRTALTFTYDSGDFGGCMDRAAELAQFEAFPERREQSAARGKLRGIGVANAIEAAGGPFGNPRPESARLRLDPEGKVVVTSGTMSTGQGLETVMRQLAADRLQIGIEQTRYEQGGSRQLPFGRGSGGSSALCVGGPALLKAADMLIEKARALASITLEVSASDIDYGEGVFRVVGTDRVLGLADLARLAPCSGSHAASEQRLSAVAEFTPPAVTFPNGCHICELEVDPETGKVDVLAYVAVEDVGTVVNPTLLKGQIQGGIAQGLGQALKERIVYDDAGQLLSGSFTDYALPLAEDLPSFILESRPVPTKVNALGAKGAGEAGTVGSLAAAMNAVCNALAPHAIVDLPMPAAPSSIWKAIRAASQRT
jgi:carbon-monoxide dehydrogenase large subunit